MLAGVARLWVRAAGLSLEGGAVRTGLWLGLAAGGLLALANHSLPLGDGGLVRSRKEES